MISIMPTESYVRDRILKALPGAEVEVVDFTGTGDHFRTVVVAEQFRGLTRIQQHQAIYASLDGDLGDHSVHALMITSKTPEEAKKEPVS